MTPTILAGDIGGTKSILTLLRVRGLELELLFENQYPSAAFASASELINRFREEAPQCSIEAACLGFAGPVIEGKSFAVNLGWRIEEQALRRDCSVANLTLLNDLVALSYGIPYLENGQLIELKNGKRKEGNIALIAAGTGLGEAVLVRNRGRHIPCPSEGGHRDFSPRTKEECDLLHFLAERYDHVSTERVLSGFGLIDILQFLLSTTHSSSPTWLQQAVDRKDASFISERALSGQDPLCTKAMNLFVSLYGSEAGNLALQYLATGGVYLGGGIATKIRPFLCNDIFRLAFTEKGRMKEILQEIPVYLINDQRAALTGAARYAADHLDRD